MSITLSEELIQESFHKFLKSSLTQAKLERLLDADVLSSAEADLMITGPALCLYFAALRSTTSPPSVPLPRQNKGQGDPLELSAENCPPAFRSFLFVWAETVPRIQNLAPEYQHDLARTICGLDPLASPTDPALNGIAADLRAVAIEISQRRSFQNRFASDLQAALDAGNSPSSPGSMRASFVPPPTYEDSSPHSSPNASPRSSVDGRPGSGAAQYATHDLPPQSPTHLSPLPPPAGESSHRPVRSPTFITEHSPAIEFIRETLYAALADALDRLPSLRALLKRDPPRAYFAAVAFAILDVSTTAMTSDGSVVGVLGKPLTLAECPRPLQPFMVELANIGKEAKRLQEEDDQQAMEYAAQGKEVPPNLLDRVRAMLEKGVGDSSNDRNTARRSVEGRAVSFTNRINGLSLSLTKLKPFRDRQEFVFEVLGGIGT